jgi:AcrR family transcriptional regulator
MSDAGLANGTFYAHFGSKNELAAAAVADQLQIQHDVLNELPDDGRSLRSFIVDCLSANHRDHPGFGIEGLDGLIQCRSPCGRRSRGLPVREDKE